MSACKKAGGPTGSGKIEVVFALDGRVASSKLVEGPMMGTPLGKCVEAKFREARVPKFAGAPVHVKKSFVVNE